MLQTDIKQSKRTLTFLTVYNGIFNVTNSINKLYFTRPVDGKDFSVISIPAGACEIGSLNKEIKRFTIDEECFTKTIYPFTLKPNFSTLGSIIEISGQRALISLLPNDSKRDFWRFSETSLYEEYEDILSTVRFKLKIENKELESFNGQNVSFRLSIKSY